MGVSYSNFVGVALANCAESNCGKRPSHPSALNRSESAVAEYNAKLAAWERCYNSCKSLSDKGASTDQRGTPTPIEALSEALSTPTDTGLSGTHGTTDVVAPVTPESTPAETANPKWSTGTKIGIGLGVLVLAYIGYKMLSGKKGK